MTDALLEQWSWPLGFYDNDLKQAFLDDHLVGPCEEISTYQRDTLMQHLFKSLSLDYSEKKIVIQSISGLTKYQYHALIDTFTEEAEKLLAKDIPAKDINKLTFKQTLEWSYLINPEAGPYLFCQHYLPKKITSAKKLGLISAATDFLIEQRHYHLASHLAGRAIDEYTKHTDGGIFNTLLYADIQLGKITATDSAAYRAFSARLPDKLTPLQLRFLDVSALDYLYSKQGPAAITQTDMHSLLRHYRRVARTGIKLDVLDVFTLHYLYRGDLTKALRVILKKLAIYSRDKQLCREVIVERFARLNQDHAISYIDNLLLLICLCRLTADERLRSVSYDLLSAVQRCVEDTRFGNRLHYARAILISEKLLGVNTLSSDPNFLRDIKVRTENEPGLTPLLTLSRDDFETNTLLQQLDSQLPKIDNNYAAFTLFMDCAVMLAASVNKRTRETATLVDRLLRLYKEQGLQRGWFNQQQYRLLTWMLYDAGVDSAGFSEDDWQRREDYLTSLNSDRLLDFFAESVTARFDPPSRSRHTD